MEITELEKKIDQRKRLDRIKSMYEFVDGLGEGGNAIALKCVDKATQNECAIKILKRYQDVSKRRFLREIKFLAEYGSIKDGIMPLVSSSEDDYWYTMPIAIGISQYLSNTESGIDRLKAVVSVIIQCAKILGRLHEKGNGHRDLKPDNIYWMNGRVVIGDFGLVEVSDSDTDSLTKNEHNLGAWNTLAPEMKRDPDNADAKKADVYSLAKTMWILITNDNKCFDGRYDWNDPKIGMHFRQGLQKLHLSEIQDLLRSATSNTPGERPTMADVVTQLEKWEQSQQDALKTQISEWEFLKKYIFGQHIPTSAVFTDPKDIVPILNIVCMSPAYNHTLLSCHGGLDLLDAKEHSEPGTVRLNLGGFVNILKPKELRIEIFANSAWNYFLLTADALPIVEGVPCVKGVQDLVCDFPCHYVDAQDFVYRVYDYDSGKPLPHDAYKVERWVSGRLLIVASKGPYNRISSVYDGRHGDMTPEDFRNYTDRLCTCAGDGDEWAHVDLNRLGDALLGTQRNDMDNQRRHIRRDIIPKEFVERNWNNFNVILDRIGTNRQDSSMQYSFSLKATEISLDDIVLGSLKGYMLKSDGTLTAEENAQNTIMHVSDIDNAIALLLYLEQTYEKWCKGAGFTGQESGYAFGITMCRLRQPVHLFSPQELRDLLTSADADDRQSNQIVIDGDGWLKLLSGESRRSMFYPVTAETFESRNGYVGKYAKWPDDKIASWYFDLLAAWTRHLKDKRAVHVDGTPLGPVDVKELCSCYSSQKDVLAILDSSDVKNLNSFGNKLKYDPNHDSSEVMS